MALHDFIDRSVSPYHVVETTRSILSDNGFQEVSSSEGLAPGKYFVVRGGKCVFAWINRGPAPVHAFHIVSVHTDFPALKVKSQPFKLGDAGNLVATAPYDGPNLATWVDRDLGIAGMTYCAGETKPVAALVKSDLTVRTIGVPPHLRAEKAGPNPQTDLHCFMGGPKGLSEENAWEMLLRGTDATGVPLEHDLFLYDKTNSTRFGQDQAYLSSARLDNLASCYSALEALTNDSLDLPDGVVPVVAFFDAEEIGSNTWLGAKSPLLGNLLRQIAGPEYEQVLGRSGHVSLDVAQGVNPLAPEIFDSPDTPHVGSGPVLKYGLKGNYTYNAHLMAHIKMLGRDIGQNLQAFSYRADKGQGGSLGPHISTNLPVRSVDIGTAIFSMHSIREACSISDIDDVTRLMRAFFEKNLPFDDACGD